MSEFPALVSAPPPKSTAPWNRPVTSALPALSTATETPPSLFVPPKRSLHSWLPGATA